MTSKTEVNRPPRANRSSFVEHLVQTHRVYLLMRHLTGLYSMQFEPGAISRVATCSRICSCKSLAFQQHSTPQNFLMLNLKDFREERRVEHLVPNQIPILFEICWNLLFLTD